MEHIELNCDCMNMPKLPCNMVIAMAYVPWQEFKNISNLKDGYHNGTIFKDLDKPFIGGKICR